MPAMLSFATVRASAPRRAASGPRRGILLAAALALLAGAAGAQDTVKEVRAQAQAALAVGAYEDAIPPLQQLIEWFGESPTDSMKAEMEDIYFRLGLCHLFLAQFKECRTVFDTYLKKFKYGANSALVGIFIGDTWRYEGKYADALKAYEKTLKAYEYSLDLRTDIFVCMARCHLAEEKWAPAEPLLIEIYRTAPDPMRRNWAAAMLATSYFKELAVDKVYPMVPLLLQPGSFAARSVAMNMSALQAGDEIFADEKYRDALWVYRLVHPHDTLKLNCEEQLARWQMRVKRLQRTPGLPRELLRAQETVSEIENELQGLEKIPNYDPELFYRIARSYMETRRLREAGEMFYNLYQEGLEEKREENLYYAFLCSSRIKPTDKCLARGHEYMDEFPGGPHYDTISLTVGQIYAGAQNWPKVLQVLGKALEVSPKHEDIVEVLFLLGYASFMEEKMPDAQRHFGRIVGEFPDSERESDSRYWLGMAFLFDKMYEDARPNFDKVVQNFGTSVFAEDASFRSATCDFGLSQFYDAERKLLAFVQRYPESKLLGEAYVILGDVSGAVGELEEAVRRYQKALPMELNVELYNYAAFRCGEMLRELKKYQDCIDHFTAYIQRARPESNVPLAVYWIGEAYWDLGQPEVTLKFFLDALSRFGKDRKELGVDLILEKWVDRTRGAGKVHGERAWLDARGLLKKALTEKDYVLALRLERIIQYDPNASDAEKAAMQKFMLRADNLPYASAGVLEWMVDAAVAAKNPELARAAAETIIREFTETDYALTARRLLAQQAMDAGAFDDAIVQYNIIREVYASSDDAAQALLVLGSLYREKGEVEKADASYKDLLGAKEWKALWPAALYGRGELWQAQRKYDQAAAYFERIYVLYAGHKDWVGRAYIARAECLGKLGQIKAAVETLDEFLNRAEWAQLPETEPAKELRLKFQSRI
jgi:tetratricopeptide (TPR) repeat protein